MIPFPHGDIAHLLVAYGYVVIAGMVAVEGTGIPLPGETTPILAAILAGNSHGLDIKFALGAITGDNIGYCLGRWLGYRLLLRFGHCIRLTESRIKLGQYLFRRRGAHRVMGSVGIVLGIAALAVIGAIALFLYRNEARLTAEAERALPGPLGPPRHR